MFFFESTAAAGGQSATSMIIMTVLIIVAFYFFMIRPENKKKKQQEAMRNSIKVGDNITTIGGIIGTVCHIKDDVIVIEVGADRVRLEFFKWAISTNNTAEEAAKAAAKNVRKK